MTERHAPPGMNFCAQCGARLPAGARFCAGCGRALAAPVGGARDARALRDQIPGLVVMTLFLAVGLGIWVTVLRPAERTPSAPGRPAPPAGPATGSMPPDHPPIALPDEAKKFITSLVAKAEAAPTDVSAWRSLAQVQARASEIEPSFGQQAIDSYRRVLSLAPDDSEALRSLGNLYYDQQQYAASAENYERYLKLNPDDPNVRTDLGTAYLYQRQVDRAIEIYDGVLAAHPDFMQAHFNLGLAWEAKGEREKALASLTKARTLAPDDATRGQIDRVTAQLKGATGAAGGPGPVGGPPGMGGAAAVPPVAGAVVAPAGAQDFRGAVEAALRAHQILGSKITAIEWPDPSRARVLVADFPMQAMPDSIRNMFRARLETILDDAKTRYAVTDERVIEIVDAANGSSMERVAH